MQNVAVGWLALQSFHSGTILGIVTAVRYAPMLLFGLWGGLVVDRMDTRSLLIVTQSLQASLSLALGVFAISGHVQLALLVSVVACVGIVDIFDVPSRQSIVGELVDRDNVGNAIALNAISTNSARALGPAIAGGIIATLGIAPCFFINAASFGAVITSLAAMRTREFFPATRELESRGQVRAGLRYIRHKPELLAPIVMVAVTGTLTWEFPVTLPLLTASTFHGNAAAYGFAMAALGIGSVVGGWIAARRRMLGVRALARSALIWGVVVLAAASAPSLTAEYVLLLGVGGCAITFNAAAKTLLQTKSASQMRGRVMSVWYIAWQGSTVVGAPIVGTLGKAFGARYGLVVGGGAAMLVGAAYLKYSAAAAAEVPTSELALEFADE
jgi:MFS family permease